MIVEAFSFANQDITNFSKRVILDILAAKAAQKDMETYVDSLDACMVFSTDELKSYRDSLHIARKEEFEASKKSVLSHYLTLMRTAPEHFTTMAAHWMLTGVFFAQYFQFVANLSYEMFLEILEKADCSVSEGQIALLKGGRKL